ncbi:hypothetical protein [uncultured Lactobacillus sp.]|uniref:hypothetical protein n=1 Tax=uncultured Lactobacillus sp. TaxID=153152 RepID=UPI00261CD34A|nr:hypothetical protein [uncultured Lactobacillus sp.]
MTSSNFDPILLISSIDQSEEVGKSVKIYVEQTDQTKPYNLRNFVNITAYDATGTKNLTDRVQINSKHVKYNIPGKYQVSVSVMDDDANLALGTFEVNVVSPEQARQLEEEWTKDTITQDGSLKEKKRLSLKQRLETMKRKPKRTCFIGGVVFLVVLFIYCIVDMFM